VNLNRKKEIMRISKLVTKTQREIPAEADTPSHQLLIRAGMISQVAAGVYNYLPLAWRSLRKIENIIRDEMDKAGGQEVFMPTLQPLELWQKSGRDQAFGSTLPAFRTNDRRDHTLVLAPTHEECVTEIVAHHVHSYRDLPVTLYQMQNKFRDEPRPRAGLIRVREFIMLDAYSFDKDQTSQDVNYQLMVQAYKNIYNRCGLKAIMVEADSGAIGGKDSHEFMAPAETGEDTILTCPKCGYAANAEKAVFSKAISGRPSVVSPFTMEEVATPGKKSIEEVAGFLGVQASGTLKAVFYMADGQFIFVVIRGDLPVNEIKLAHALKVKEVRMATEAEVLEKGIFPGAASPGGLKGMKVIADDSVTTGTNFVAGGNKPDTHLKNVNYPRDFQTEIVTDIALAKAGDACLKCGTELQTIRGIEIGHIFKLGTTYSEKLGAYFTDESGNPKIITMGCYGIGVGRLLAAIVEQSHDDKGIIWPAGIAPYQVHLCALYPENSQVMETAEKIYTSLAAEGIEVLYDDRPESPGVKFNDADLLGMPLRITVSPRNLDKNSVEVKWRTEKKAQLLPLEGIVGAIKNMINSPQ
jgi:prolyl-tRNA synthetase